MSTHKCPLCNFVVETYSNHRHRFDCPNAFRPFSQWLQPEDGYPVIPHPDEEEILDTTGVFTVDTSSDDQEDVTTSNPDPVVSDPEPEPEFGGGGGFEGGGGGDSW